MQCPTNINTAAALPLNTKHSPVVRQGLGGANFPAKSQQLELLSDELARCIEGDHALPLLVFMGYRQQMPYIFMQAAHGRQRRLQNDVIAVARKKRK
jgi:hypothetical protein